MAGLGGKVIAAFATFVAVLTYLAIGAAIFQKIEQDHEVEQREEYDKQLAQLLEKVDPVFHPELKAPCHMIEILEADPNKTQQWEFVNSVIFCLTIVTTIGYGATFPVTDEGRGFCIFFALVGIPLFMACLAVYAQHTANFIRWVMKALGLTEGIEPEKAEKMQQLITAVFCLTVILTFSGYLTLREGWSYSDSVYFTFISFTTIGFGDLYPSTDTTEFHIVFIMFLILGLISLGTVIEAQTNNFGKLLSAISSSCDCFTNPCARFRGGNRQQLNSTDA